MIVRLNRQIIRFLLAGVINTALTYVMYLLLLPLIGYLMAYSMAYLTGIVISYLLNTKFVFRVRHSVRGAALYPLIYVGQYFLGLVSLDIAIRYLGISKPFALLASLVVTVPTTYLLTSRLLRTTTDICPHPPSGTRE